MHGLDTSGLGVPLRSPSRYRTVGAPVRRPTLVVRGSQVELIADRYRREPAGRSPGGILNPARDRLSGAVVSVLHVPAPDDAGGVAAEADRLRRYARVRHPHLAEVREVEAHAGSLDVVCEPLRGSVLSSGEHSHVTTVQDVQRLAGDVLEALAALHRSGVVHGAVSERCLLLSHRTGPTTEPEVTLLPLPAVPPGGGRGVTATRSDDVRAAATTFLALLDRTPKRGLDASVLAAGLARALRRAGGVGPPADSEAACGFQAAEVVAREGGDPPGGAAPRDSGTSAPDGERHSRTKAPPRGTAADR